tara:strand:- start:157 stop:540 length:384 start_codon:yes stop_codon:yes gene_type:complete
MINYNSCATQNAINEVILEFNSVGIGSTTILPSQTGIGYSGISTVGTAYTMPTQSDLETKVNVKLNNERWNLIRKERNRKLSETDWIVTKLYELGDPVPIEWKAYRQSLRDITTQDINNITWPTKPS